jgi:hypothetical protein
VQRDRRDNTRTPIDQDDVIRSAFTTAGHLAGRGRPLRSPRRFEVAQRRIPEAKRMARPEFEAVLGRLERRDAGGGEVASDGGLARRGSTMIQAA